jgi:hypothetical protein
VQFALDGQDIGERIDCHNGQGGTEATHCVRVEHVIEGIDLQPGRHRLTVTCVGKNEASEGYMAGIDRIVLRP